MMLNNLVLEGRHENWPAKNIRLQAVIIEYPLVAYSGLEGPAFFDTGLAVFSGLVPNLSEKNALSK